MSSVSYPSEERTVTCFGVSSRDVLAVSFRTMLEVICSIDVLVSSTPAA
jgi:hypothetical protein